LSKLARLVDVYALQLWGRLPWFAPFLRRAFFLRRRFEDIEPSLSARCLGADGQAGEVTR
ncbi:hypothetical protein ABZ943_30235, partial [Streptomyces rubiginosohelvolus]